MMFQNALKMPFLEHRFSLFWPRPPRMFFHPKILHAQIIQQCLSKFFLNSYLFRFYSSLGCKPSAETTFPFFVHVVIDGCILVGANRAMVFVFIQA